MKNWLLRSTLLFASVAATTGFAAAAQADNTVCGQLISSLIKPKCEGFACPHWVKIQYSLITAQGEKINLETQMGFVYKEVAASVGQNICATGELKGDVLEVTDLRAAR